MGATLVLGTSVERRESSNLSLVTGNGLYIHVWLGMYRNWGIAQWQLRLTVNQLSSSSAVRVRLPQQKCMNREQYLQETFPTKDGKTYIQSLDEFNSKKEEDVKEDTCRSGGINNDADE